MTKAAELENIPKAQAHPHESFRLGYHPDTYGFEPALFFKDYDTAVRHRRAVQLLIGTSGIVFTCPHDFGFYTEIVCR
jgi:hypothetical protein